MREEAGKRESEKNQVRKKGNERNGKINIMIGNTVILKKIEADKEIYIERERQREAEGVDKR